MVNASEAASSFGGKMFTDASDCTNARVFNLFPRDVTYCFVIKTSVIIFCRFHINRLPVMPLRVLYLS